MKATIIGYIATGLAMLVLDSIWLVLTADRLYRANIGSLMRPGFGVAPAIIFYLIYVFGVTILVVQPALGDSHPGQVLLRGALLGIVAYATYDLTNQATLRGWSTTVTIADLCWGTFLTMVAATVGWWATRQFAPLAG